MAAAWIADRRFVVEVGLVFILFLVMALRYSFAVSGETLKTKSRKPDASTYRLLRPASCCQVSLTYLVTAG